MDRRLISGVLALAAAAALGVGGATLSAFTDYADVPGNHFGAGVLLLDLGRAGSASTPISFTNLVPGQTTEQAIWVAANDVSSTPDGTLSLTLHNLVDVPAPCSAGGSKALGEFESGIGGCTIVGGTVTGTPAQGNLSRVLQLDIAYDPAASNPASCAADTGITKAALPATGRGSLFTNATANGGSGTTVPFTDGTAPLVLAPGQGVCVAVSASWPQASVAPDPQHPSDNATQADSLTVDIRFDLTQVQP